MPRAATTTITEPSRPLAPPVAGALPVSINSTAAAAAVAPIEYGSAPPGGKGAPRRATRPFNVFRHKVSVNKRRYTEGGWDLDLTYITPRIIALGFPALRAGTRWWRNRMEDVSLFMKETHGTNVRLYNLCVEEAWGYSPKWFQGNAVRFGMIDKHPPPLQQILLCLQDMQAWLRADPNHVVAVHCRAGKGRTGVVISCFLLYTGICSTGEEALDFFDHARTAYGLAVNLPSQRRLVKLFGELMRQGVVPPADRQPVGLAVQRILLPRRDLIVRSVVVSAWTGQGEPMLRVVMAEMKEERNMQHVTIYTQRAIGGMANTFAFDLHGSVVVNGLFGLEVYETRLGRQHRVAACWMHTLGVPTSTKVHFAAPELDGPHKKYKPGKKTQEERWATQGGDIGMLVTLEDAGGAMMPPAGTAEAAAAGPMVVGGSNAQMRGGGAVVPISPRMAGLPRAPVRSSGAGMGALAGQMAMANQTRTRTASAPIAPGAAPRGGYGGGGQMGPQMNYQMPQPQQVYPQQMMASPSMGGYPNVSVVPTQPVWPGATNSVIPLAGRW